MDHWTEELPNTDKWHGRRNKDGSGWTVIYGTVPPRSYLDEICGHCATCKWWGSIHGLEQGEYYNCHYEPRTVPKHMCDFCRQYEFFEGSQFFEE
jgi:hypothetical protein